MLKIFKMKVDSKTFFNASLHVAFCVILIVLFGTFCKLRTAAAMHPHLEYFSGVIVLGMMYFNAYVLFPVYYRSNRVQPYVLFGLVTIVLSCFFEMLLVSSDILQVLRQLFDEVEARKLFLTDALYVMMRDAVMFFVSFSLAALPYYASMNYNKELSIMQELQQLEATTTDKKKTTVYVKIQKVAYIYQNQNYMNIYLTNGERVIRYGSLKQLKSLLDDDCYVQLSNKLLVMCENILRYDASGVVVKLAPKNALLTYSMLYKDKAMGELFEKTNFNPNESSSENQSQRPPTHRRQLKEKSEKLIFDFIAKHPGCSAAEIKKNRSISQATVNRILKKLKDEGLIEYVGSKKTGGYRVKEGTHQDSMNSEAH